MYSLYTDLKNLQGTSSLPHAATNLAEDARAPLKDQWLSVSSLDARKTKPTRLLKSNRTRRVNYIE